MINLSKISSLFLSGLLFYLSVSASYGYFLPDNDHLSDKSNGKPEYWFVEASNLISLTKPFKNNLKSPRNFSVFNINDFLNKNRSLPALAEQNHYTTSKRYLTFSKSFYPRLNVRTIIFPFHYFW